MKIGVVGNIVKIRDETVVGLFLRFLQTEGYEAVLFEKAEDIGGVDALVVLGGDGAILHAATEAARKNIKLIGINYGNLGFLTEYEKEETERVKELLSELREGSCPILRRTMLELEVNGQKHYGLNEVVLQRDYSAADTQIAKLNVKINGEDADTVVGDGLLLCTPTGSTAYSLSAGGALLTPQVPAFMLTPICAFSLNVRPLIFPDTDIVSMSVSKGKVMLLIDGKQVSPIMEGMEVTVRKAPFTADFPRRGDSCFYRKIRTKLNQ